MRLKKILPIFALLLGVVFLSSCSLLASKLNPPDAVTCTDGHSFEVQEVTKKATCGAAGTQTVKCSVCGATEEQEIPATGQHRLQGWLTTVAPTLNGRGERVRSCERCGTVVERETLSSIGAAVPVQVTGEAVAVDLSSYQVIYDDSFSTAFYSGALEALGEAIRDVTGAPVTLYSDVSRPLDTGAAELLIGDTNRAASRAAKELIHGDGFAVAVENGKIAIVGTDAMQTIQGIQYLIRTYLSAGVGEVSLHSRAIASDVPLQLVATELGCEYRLVFDQRLDNDPNHKYVSSAEGDSRDYPCVAAEELSTSIAELMSSGAKKPAVGDDRQVSNLEVLIGRMERAESKMLQATLEGDEYAILVKDGKIVLCGSNDIALAECLSQFRSLLELGIRDAEDDSNGYYLPEGFFATGRVEKGWVMDFPKPTGEGIALYGTQYVNDDSLQFLYTGDGVSADAYRAYCAELLRAGYTAVCENSIEGSFFTTLVHTAKGVTLSVAYQVYGHESEYAVEDEYNVDYETCIRIVSAPLTSVTLPDGGLLNEDPVYEKVTESSITAIPYTGKAVGMGYVILLEDGRMVLVDGGGVNSGGTEHELLWETLCKVHEQAYGSMPTASNPVHLAAWIVTHSHFDHYYAFHQLMKKRASSGYLRIDYLIGNFPEETAIYAVSGSTLFMGNSQTIPAMQALLPDGFTYVKVHTGQRFTLANVTLEVLMTFEDHYPRRICNSNDTCTIVRMEIANSTVPSAEPVSMIFLADAFRFQSRFLCAMYGTYLQSDIVQLAHHGNIGCEKAIYTAIAPTVVYFPNAYAAYSTYTSESNRNKAWNYAVDYYVVHELQSVRYIYVANARCVTLPFGVNGPRYDAIYNTVTGESLPYTGTDLVQK